MTPEARERRRIRTPVLAVTTVAWTAILLAEPVMSRSGAEQRSGPAALDPRLTHSGHAHHSVLDTGAFSPHAWPANVTFFLVGWTLMLIAMMAPLLIPALRHVYARSLQGRRWRAVSLVTLAYAAVWTLGGAALITVASAVQSVTGQGVLAMMLVLVAALTWQLSPLKQRCLNMHCAHPPIAAFGGASDRDVLRFGSTHAVWCLGSCWALMLVPLLTPAWHVTVMLMVSAWIWAERLDRPERPTWRIRVPLRFLRIAEVAARSLAHSVAMRASASPQRL